MLRRGASKASKASKVRVQSLGAEIEVPGPRTCLAAACLRVGVAQDAMPDLHGLQRPCPPCPISLWLTYKYKCEVLCVPCKYVYPQSTDKYDLH